MASEWIMKRLGDLAELHKDQIHPDGWPEDLFQHFSIPAFDSGETPVLETGASIKSHKFTVPPDAILVSKLNPRIRRIWEPNVEIESRSICSTEFLVLRPRRGISRRFLKYVFLSPAVRAAMQARVTGTSGSHQRVSAGDTLAINVRVPRDPSEQRAIAQILGTLDDKIELNRQMNETLEAMAQALFQSWFVDFDPVRAKAKENTPGLPLAIAALFPNSLEERNGADAPSGWTRGPVSNTVTLLRDTVHPTREPDEGFVHFSIPAFDSGRQPMFERGVEIRSGKFRVLRGTVLLSKLNPEIERVWLVDIEDAERSVCSTEFLVLRPKRPFTRAWIYCLLRSPAFRQRLTGFVTGTSKSHQRVQPSTLLAMEIVLPASQIVRAFDDFAEPLFTRIHTNIRESRTLAALRDTLLPKLISGEIRVSEAEKAVVAAL
jgi:type I restriction enzyme S subunit